MVLKNSTNERVAQLVLSCGEKANEISLIRPFNSSSNSKNETIGRQRRSSSKNVVRNRRKQSLIHHHDIGGNAVDNLVERVFYERQSVLAHIQKLNDVDLKCDVNSPAVRVDTWLAAGMAAQGKRDFTDGGVAFCRVGQTLKFR